MPTGRMTIAVFAFLILTLTTLLPPGQAGAAIASDPVIAEAIAGLEREDYDGAAAGLKKALEKSPQNEDYWFKLAEVRWHQAEWLPKEEKAKKIVLYNEVMNAGRQGLKINPESPGARFWVAAAIGSLSETDGIMKNLYRFPEVISHLRAIAKKDPNFYYGAVHIYWTLMTIRFPPLARRMTGLTMQNAFNHVESAVKQEPRLFKNHFVLAQWYIEAKQYDEARKELNKIAVGDPQQMPEMAWQNRYYVRESRRVLQELDADKKTESAK